MIITCTISVFVSVVFFAGLAPGRVVPPKGGYLRTAGANFLQA